MRDLITKINVFTSSWMGRAGRPVTTATLSYVALDRGIPAATMALKGNPLRDIGDIGKVELVVRSGQILDLTGLRRAAEASFAETPDDAITNHLLDLIEPDYD